MYAYKIYWGYENTLAKLFARVRQEEEDRTAYDFIQLNKKGGLFSRPSDINIRYFNISLLAGHRCPAALTRLNLLYA
jgi:hypothetical protein